MLIILFSVFSFHHLYKTSEENLLESKLEASKREAREMGMLIELELKGGLSKDNVIKNLQRSIENTDIQSGFICMYNSKGIELCHPNPALVGQKIDKNNSKFLPVNSTPADFRDILRTDKASTGIRHFPREQHRSSEIVSVYPIAGSDWRLASHANIKVLNIEIEGLYKSFLITFFSSTILLLILAYILIRWIYKKYEERKNSQIESLNSEVKTLSILNSQLKQQQEKLKNVYMPDDDTLKQYKKRVNVYFKDELISLEVIEIACFSVKENLTTIFLFNGQHYQSTQSLEEIYRTINPSLFYRANRQFLVNIKAIKSIVMYGKNQLRIIVSPLDNQHILISKNKVSDFKKWLEQ
ncbi:LytTR family transcriptional regulator DNA-binding domain-containing protein [Weeksellaceae bacterium A-14]